MTPFVRWLRNAWQRSIGAFYEGPEAPDRLRAMVIVFANTFPNATRGEWVRFAVEHASECYRSGYMRGVEYAERDPEGWMPGVPPESIADALDPDWRWSDPVDLIGSPDALPPPNHDDARETRDQYQRLTGGDPRRMRKP